MCLLIIDTCARFHFRDVCFCFRLCSKYRGSSIHLSCMTNCLALYIYSVTSQSHFFSPQLSIETCGNIENLYCWRNHKTCMDFGFGKNVSFRPSSCIFASFFFFFFFFFFGGGGGGGSCPWSSRSAECYFEKSPICL